MGHIMPDMTSASLFGIRLLCKAGCMVVFDDNICQVIYDGKIFLQDIKILPATFGFSRSFRLRRPKPPMMLRIIHHLAPV
jgi:hypothetical protein